MGDLFPSSFRLVVCRQNPFAQIQRECFHAWTLPHLKSYGYSFI
jgi:hypothetical protein